MIDRNEVWNGLQNQLDSIELDLATSYSHVIGDDAVTEALEGLRTAVSRSDGKPLQPAIARSWQMLRLLRNQSLRESLKTYYMLRLGTISRNSRYKEKSFKDQRDG
jgi:predicted amidohydrolase YtcJ